MFNHWNDIERTWAAMEALRRGVDQAFSRSWAGEPAQFGRFVEAAAQRSVGLDVFETEDGFLVTADLPGFKKEDVEVQFVNDHLVLSAKRQPEAPEGYQTVMEERGALSLQRTLAFPTKVDGEHIEAKLADGVLELRVPKHPEAKPRQIPVNLG